ncbi:MAG: hypothetical protein ACE5NM_03615 [Sedimentisphaerales bacterium]
MLKNSLIVVAALTILAIVVSPATAGAPKEEKHKDALRLKANEWPVEFKWVDLENFVIPVYIDVELYMEIPNMKKVVKEGIHLKQVSLTKYEGCSIPIEVKSNFDLKLGVKLLEWKAACQDMGAEKDTLEVRDADCADEASSVSKTLGGDPAKRTVYFKIKDVDPYKYDYAKKEPCADILVRVKPNFDAGVWVDP